MRKILVVDDEEDALELMTFNLRAAGFQVLTASDGQEALSRARSQSPSLIVLDVMLPEVDGLEVCRILKRDPLTYTVPIILLTALSSEISRVVGLESGADDYLTKPVSPRELISRVNSLLHQPSQGQSVESFHLKDLFINPSDQVVTVEGRRVDMTRREIKVLSFLAKAITRRLNGGASINQKQGNRKMAYS